MLSYQVLQGVKIYEDNFMVISLIISIVVVAVSYFLISNDRVILNIISVGVIYGFISFIIFILLSTRYSDTNWLSQTLVSVVYMIIMYRSDLTKLITKSRKD